MFLIRKSRLVREKFNIRKDFLQLPFKKKSKSLEILWKKKLNLQLLQKLISSYFNPPIPQPNNI